MSNDPKIWADKTNSSISHQLRYVNTVSWIGENVAVHMRKVDNPECQVISPFFIQETGSGSINYFPVWSDGWRLRWLGRLSSPILPYPSVTSTCYLWRHISQPWQLSITKLVLKSARGMNEQVLKTWGADVLSSRKKLRKTSWGSGIHPPPPLYVRGLISTCFCSLFWQISKRQRGKTQHVFRIWWHFPFPA